MEKPEEPPAPADPGEPRASRATTIMLIVSLVLIVLTAGVLGTVAVLMTRTPDAPLIGGSPPHRLAVPIHFAPVRETRPAPCPAEETAVTDEPQTTCYLLENGVTVNAVQKIEAVREKDGTYSVRVAVAPAYKQRLVELIDELAEGKRQVAVVLVPRTVVAAPIVAQSMDGDSLSIAGYGQQEAEALATRLLGGTAAPVTPGASTPATTTTTTATGSPGLPGTTPPGTTGTPGATGTTGTTGAGGPDPRFGSCREAVAAGYGPYTRGVHQEYAWYTDTDNNGVACNTADLS